MIGHSQQTFNELHLVGKDGVPLNALDDPDGYRVVNVLEPDDPPETSRTCVIILHGGGTQDPQAVWDQVHFQALQDAENFFAFLPQAILDPNAAEMAEDQRHNWNDGRNVTSVNDEEEGILENNEISSVRLSAVRASAAN